MKLRLLTVSGILCLASAIASSNEPRSARGGVLAQTGGSGYSRVELEGVLHDILAWLPGHYDSMPQIDNQRRYGAPRDGEHEHWYRVFARVNAPQIGQHVFYQQLHLGGMGGTLVPGTQVVFNVRIDERSGTVLFESRRIKNPHEFVDAHLRPEVQGRLDFDPMTGGNCEFRWHRYGDHVRGILNHDGTCAMTSKVTGQDMAFESEWFLTDSALWVRNADYVVGKGQYTGRPDRVPMRLARANPYWCEIRIGAEQVQRLLTHDLGYPLKAVSGGRTLEVVLLKGARKLRAPYAEPVTSITVRDAEGRTLAESVSPGRADAASLVWPAGAVSCNLATDQPRDVLLNRLASGAGAGT